MRSVVFAVIAVVALLSVGLLGALPSSTAAQDAPPGASGTPTTACAGATGAAVASPSGEQEAVVQVAGYDGSEDLYLAVIEMEANSCVDYRYRNGAIVLYVVEGPVFYTATNAAMPDVQITRGNSDGENNDGIPVALDTEIELQTGDWVAQDRRVWFTFRTGENPAVVSAAAFAVPPWEDDSCLSGCRNRP